MFTHSFNVLTGIKFKYQTMFKPSHILIKLYLNEDGQLENHTGKEIFLFFLNKIQIKQSGYSKHLKSRYLYQPLLFD